MFDACVVLRARVSNLRSKLLLVPAAGLTLWGTYGVYWVTEGVTLNYALYGRPFDLQKIAPIAALAFVGLVLLTVAVAGVKGKAAAFGALVATLAVMAGVGKLGLARGEASMQAAKESADLGNAAAGVCAGKPVAGAGSRRTVMMGLDSDEEPGKWFGFPWKGLPAPTTLAELGLVACRKSIEELVTTCNYTSTSGSPFTIYKYRVTHDLRVRDAKTAQVLGQKYFAGGEPSTSCDEKVTSFDGKTERSTSGDAPSEKDEVDFIRTFMER